MPYNVINKLKVFEKKLLNYQHTLHNTVDLNSVDIWNRECQVIMTSEWQYKHDSKAKDLVAHVNTPEHPLYPWHDKQHGGNIKESEISQLIKTNINFLLCLSGCCIANACAPFTWHIEMSKIKLTSKFGSVLF